MGMKSPAYQLINKEGDALALSQIFAASGTEDAYQIAASSYEYGHSYQEFSSQDGGYQLDSSRYPTRVMRFSGVVRASDGHLARVLAFGKGVAYLASGDAKAAAMLTSCSYQWLPGCYQMLANLDLEVRLLEPFLLKKIAHLPMQISHQGELLSLRYPPSGQAMPCDYLLEVSTPSEQNNCLINSLRLTTGLQIGELVGSIDPVSLLGTTYKTIQIDSKNQLLYGFSNPSSLQPTALDRHRLAGSSFCAIPIKQELELQLIGRGLEHLLISLFLYHKEVF
jgi:hypothetical protein